MTQRGLSLGLLVAIGFVVATVLFFANWPDKFLQIPRPTTPGDFGQLFGAAQSIFSGLGVVGIVYTILRQHLDLQEQRKATTVSLELAASATLFAYYNDKIVSLRNAIKRDAAASPNLRELLGTRPLDANTRLLTELLAKHEALRKRMELLNESLCPPSLEPTPAT